MLDECNGRNITGNPNYSYAYFVTPTFPYLMGCLRGTRGSYAATTLSASPTTTGSSGSSGGEASATSLSVLLLALVAIIAC